MALSWCNFADGNTRNNLATVCVPSSLLHKAMKGNTHKPAECKAPINAHCTLAQQQDPAFEFSGQNFSLKNTT